MNSILRCQQLSKTYGKLHALKSIDLDLERGRIVGLLGPNGSGKTTLIKLINGLLQPTKGKVEVNGQPIGVASKKIVSYLPDHTYLNDWMKVKDLVQFFADCYQDFDQRLAYKLLSDLRIDEKQLLKALSKGNKEKVQLILVMSRHAQLYLLDEPIAGVDPAARDYILRTIMQNYNKDATVIISTHLIADVEGILDDVIFLKEGEIVLKQDKNSLVEEKQMTVDALFREVFKC